jgi:peroxiredoxin
MRGAVVLLATASALGCAGAAHDRGPALEGAVRAEWGHPHVGDAAPEFDLPALGGGTVKLSSMRGSWVLLHFTATWCPFCDTEIVHLGEIASAYRERGVRVVLIGVREPQDRWTTYARSKVSPSVVTLADSDGAAAARFAPPGAIPAIPERAEVVLAGTLLIDPQGTIRLFVLPDSAHFDPTLRDVLAELDRLMAGGHAVHEPPVPADGRAIAVEAAPVHAAAGASGELTLLLHVAEGFHVMSDRPSKPEYIATRVSFDSAGIDGIALGAPRYPPPVPFALDRESIATFRGDVRVVLPFDVRADVAAGAHTVPGWVRYQACTASRCLFPRTEPLEATILVTPR